MNDYTNQYFAGTNGDALEIRNEATSGMRNPTDWFYDWATGGGRTAGVAVNGYTALTHCPLWQGVNIIAGDFGQTPVRLLKNKFDEQDKHPAWNLLRVRPNRKQTPPIWLETMMQWKLIWGNGVSWIRRQGSRPVELIPLRPDCLWHEVIEFEEEPIVLYHYQGPYRNSRRYTFFPDEVLHFQGLTSDGIWGYPLWQVGKNTIAHGLALQKHGNSTFENGAQPGGVLESPAGNAISKDPEARKNLRNEWNQVHRGPDNAGAVAILWEGITYKQMAQSNVEAQWLDAMKATVYQAAALLQMPPYKLGAMDQSGNRANLEEQNADYVSSCLSRHYNLADHEYRRKLLTEAELVSDKYRFKHDYEAFLRGDIDTLSTVADRLVKGELANRNEGREMIGLPPYPGGEKFGSPAINPQQQRPEDGKESPDNGRPRNQVENAHKDLLLDRMLHFIERESISLKQAAAGAKNFVKWLDEFYAQVDGQDPKIFALCDSVMGSSIRASCAAGVDARGITGSIAAYARKRHSQLLEACSEVTKEQLPATIEALANDNTTLVAQGLLATALGGNYGFEN